MKNITSYKKIQFITLMVVLFLTSTHMAHAVFKAPTAGPTAPNGQPELFIFKDKQMQLKDGDPMTPDPVSPANYTLRTTKQPGLGIGLGTEGLLSWTADFDALVQNSNRALIAYGKLVADLSGVTGLSPYARTAVKLFSNSAETMLTTVVSNRPYLGFWLDGFPLGNSSCQSCGSGVDGWATGFFGRAALSSLIIGPHDFGWLSYSQNHNGNVRTDLDVAGDTNFGQGNFCVIRREDTCPMGAALTWVFTEYATKNYANQIETIEGLPLSSIPNTYSNLCTYIDPVADPTFIGMCPLDPIGTAVNGMIPSVTGYDPGAQLGENGADVVIEDTTGSKDGELGQDGSHDTGGGIEDGGRDTGGEDGDVVDGDLGNVDGSGGGGLDTSGNLEDNG